MTEFIEQVFSTIFGENVVLATILIAIVPIIELKGAIPFATSSEIWGMHALNLWQSFGCAFLGSSLVVPILALIYSPLIRWFKSTKLFRNLALKLENKVNKKKQKIESDVLDKVSTDKLQETNNRKKSERKTLFLKILGVFTFVAIPLPFTGVWTGTCIAVALGLNFWISSLTVILGNAVAGLLITLITMFFGDQSLLFFYIFVGIIILGLLFFFIKFIVSKINEKKNKYNNALSNNNQNTNSIEIIKDEKINDNSSSKQENEILKNDN